MIDDNTKTGNITWACVPISEMVKDIMTTLSRQSIA